MRVRYLSRSILVSTAWRRHLSPVPTSLLTQAVWAGAGLVVESPGCALDGDVRQQLLEQGMWGRNPHLERCPLQLRAGLVPGKELG